MQPQNDFGEGDANEFIQALDPNTESERQHGCLGSF